MSDRYPFPGLTKAQREALEQIGAGNRCPPMGKKTLAVLLERGLIVRRRDDVIGRDRFGPITRPVYEMPVAEHIRWCDWCAEKHKECPCESR